jgi:hypothetical protein
MSHAKEARALANDLAEQFAKNDEPTPELIARLIGFGFATVASALDAHERIATALEARNEAMKKGSWE